MVNSAKYHSDNGWLLDNDNNVVFVPKLRRTILPISKVDSIDNRYHSVWNKVCSLLIRDNLQEFLSNDSHRHTLEQILLLYRKNIVESMIVDAVNRHGKYAGISVDTIEISDEIIKIDYGVTPKDINEFPRLPYREFDNNLELDVESFRSFSSIMYGQYVYKDKKIILYVNAMKTSGKTGRDLEDLFIATFVHELFHAYHFDMIFSGHEGKNEIGYISKHDIIIESLADYFEYYICNEVLENSALSNELSDSWDRHNILIYPYSGARTMRENGIRYFINFLEFASWLEDNHYIDIAVEHEIHEYEHHNHLGITKFIKYFNLTLISLEMAESMLLGDSWT